MDEESEGSTRPDIKKPDSPPRLLTQVHEAIRRKYYSRRTEEAYVHWIKRFIYFHGKRHPHDMGEAVRVSLQAPFGGSRRRSDAAPFVRHALAGDRL